MIHYIITDLYVKLSVLSVLPEVVTHASKAAASWWLVPMLDEKPD